MLTSLIFAAAIQASLMPGVLNIPLAPNSRVTPCPAYTREGTIPGAVVACATVNSRVSAGPRRQRDHYTAAMRRVGWTFKDGVPVAATYAKGCDELGFGTIPVREDDMLMEGPVVFLFALERNACRAEQRAVVPPP